MKKNAKTRKSTHPKVDPFVEGLMAKLLERLVSLEKKVDTIVSQTAVRHSSNGQSLKPVSVPANIPAPRRDRVLYEAICADCSKVCEVPFKPSEDRAVYCKECWAARKGRPAGLSSRPGMPVLTPVAIPPKPVSKLSAAAQAAQAHKKPKKSLAAKKSKKKK